MLILGVDPGTINTGWGIVCQQTHRLNIVEAGVIHGGASSIPLERRLAQVFEGLCSVIATHHPDRVAIEDVFHRKYAGSALKLGQVRGVGLLAAAQHGLHVDSVSPALVKHCVAGHGRAGKEQVARVVCTLLQLREPPPQDACDALAIAIASARGGYRLAGLRKSVQ